MTQFIPQPENTLRLGDYLNSHFQEKKWTHFRAAIAFAKSSGVRQIRESLTSFSETGSIKMSIGIDLGGTSMEGLQELLDCLKPPGEIWVFHNENNSTFHPKIYLFKNEMEADVIVSSGNLTEGGLYTNYEASILVPLKLSIEKEKALLKFVEDTLDSWSHLGKGTSQLLTGDLLKELVENGYITTESQAREVEEQIKSFSHVARKTPKLSLFKAVSVPRAPSKRRESIDEPEGLREEDFELEIPSPVPPQSGNTTGFLMTLQRTDVGIGQTTAGTARRSPEIFIPLAARDYDPDFWGWPHDFSADLSKPGKMDRPSVKMRIGTTIFEVNMMTWPDKHDFRLRNESLRSAGNIGDILRIERADGSGGFSYYVEVIPSGTALHGQFLALCVNPVRNSAKRWGYY